MRRSLEIFPPSAMGFLLMLASAIAGGGNLAAQTPATNRPWAYQLLHDSQLLDDCPICDRIPFLVPMQGTFQLRLLDQNPITTRYALENVSFTGGGFGRTYKVRGSGTFEIGGEVAVLQQMVLEAQIDDGVSNKLCFFTNTTSLVTRTWPMIDISIEQTNGTPAQTYSLRLAAAPIRETWFSTAGFFNASNGPAGITGIGGGDLISTTGRIVKRNGELFSSVGIHVPSPDLGLDAVDLLPGGEIAFSLGTSAPSDTLGPIYHGDLLSTQRGILRRNQELTAAFAPQPPVPDVGLDAVQVLDTGEILFSIQSNLFSEKLSATLHRGDLLSSSGLVMRSNQQLLARFHPPKAADYGLDALYVWPNGEIWFSTEDDFLDQQLGAISAGDLLSDQGYIVFQQAELLGAFAPTSTPPNFGLDALYVITDATPPALPPRLSIKAEPSTQSAALSWQGRGRVFQVERAETVTGLFQPLSPILPDLSFDDLGVLSNRVQRYYQLQQW